MLVEPPTLADHVVVAVVPISGLCVLHFPDVVPTVQGPAVVGHAVELVAACELFRRVICKGKGRGYLLELGVANGRASRSFSMLTVVDSFSLLMVEL